MVRNRLSTASVLLVAASLVLVAAAPSPRPFRTLSTSDELRDDTFVCRENRSLDCYDDEADGGRASYVDYLEHVLANEWDPRTATEALKAGSIAVRTFADRNPGCGALLTGRYEPNPETSLDARWNSSQKYWLGEAPNWYQNTVTSAHQNARAATDGVQLYRADSELACAKYKANSGDPTKACDSSACGEQLDQDTLQEVEDPVARDLGEKIAVGMPQNGTVAWEIGSASWDYRQMLTHYYVGVQLADSSDYYRWTWLNTGQSYAFLNYHGPTNPTPSVVYWMEGPQGVEPAILVQNTSRETWNAYDVMLSYRWYRTTGAPVNEGEWVYVNPTTALAPGKTAWVTSTLGLPEDLGPNGEPPIGKCYDLKWDLKRGSTWFSSQNDWPTLDSEVCVREDTNPPSNPSSDSVSCSSGHVRGGWTTSTQIALDWWGAEDSESGVYGYLLAWDETPDTVRGPSLDATDTVPRTSADTTESSATSGVLGDGNWYLHVRTQDYAGHLASGATHFGPYGIDTLAPTSVVTGSALTDPSKSWFYVELSGTDAGSGVVSYTMQYNVDGGSWQDFVSVDGPGPATRLFCASRYDPGHTYHFRSQATDAMGRTEAWGAAEWSVYIPAGADPGGLFDVHCPIVGKDYTN